MRLTLLALCLCALPLAAQERIVRVVTVYTYADGRKVVVEETSDASPKASLPAQAPKAAPHVPCEVRPAARTAPSAPCEMCKQLGGCNCTNCACDAVHGIRAAAPPAPPVILPTAPPAYAVTYDAPPVYVRETPIAVPDPRFIPDPRFVRDPNVISPRAPRFQAGARLGPASVGVCIGSR